MTRFVAQRRVVIVDDSRTIQAFLDHAFGKRPDFRVVGFAGDATMAAEMIRRLMPDIVTIDLEMPYIDGAALLHMVSDLPRICKVVVSDVPDKNLSLNAALTEAGAAVCLSKRELAANPDQFFARINAAADAQLDNRRHYSRAAHEASGAPRRPDGDQGQADPGFPVPIDEAARLRILRQKNLANSVRERTFDLVTDHIRKVTGFPVCLLTFIDRNVQWIKSASGFDVGRTPRDQAFCNYTIAQGGPFVVTNAATDCRFAKNPLVTGSPGIRCYAGHPVTTADGVQVGALCVIDNRVRSVSKHVLDELAGMSAIVADLIEQRPAMAA